MKCLSCGQENKDTAKACRKCSRDLTIPPTWFPDWQWHLRTLGVIYALVVVFYLGVTAALKTLPKPPKKRKAGHRRQSRRIVFRKERRRL